KLERLLGNLAHELEVLELGRKIQSKAEEQMGKAQREYYLREQLKAIQRELGELDSEQGELGELRERLTGVVGHPDIPRADRLLAMEHLHRRGGGRRQGAGDSRRRPL